MTRTFLKYFTILLSLIFKVPLALTITTSEEYYLVVPNSSKDIHKTVRNTSKLKGIVGNQEIKAVAVHHGTYKYNYRVKHYQNRCHISNLSVMFNSKITLPKIDLHAKRYTKSTLEKFQKYVTDRNTHEKEHRRIHIKHLQRTTNKLRKITQNNSTFIACKDLKNYIKQEFIKTSQIIRQENTKFDCSEYGIKQGLRSCKNLSNSIVATKPQQTKKTKISHFSSLTQGGKTDVKSYKDGIKPDKEECDGQLIEPFKGKFYCIPATNYSEL